MVPESYRRVWRRRLRRRPLLPWLVAGTVVADCLAVLVASPGGYLIPGGYLAQAFLLAVWLISSRAGFLLRLLLVLIGLSFIGFLLGQIIPDNTLYGISLGLGALAYSVPTVAISFLIQNHRVGMQELPEGLSFVISPRPKRIAPRLWRLKRVSISKLLLVTTVAAVLATILAAGGIQLVSEVILNDDAAVFFLTPALAIRIIHETVKRTRRLRTILGTAAAVWFLGFLALWQSGTEFEIGPAAFYQLAVVSVAIVWLVGLRIRNPHLGSIKAARTPSSVVS